jgi:hypothetical protein
MKMASARVTEKLKNTAPTRTGVILVLFHEYFHGEIGCGLGASHQTGWTALAVRLLENAVENPDRIDHAHEADSGDASDIRAATGAKRGRLADRAALAV